LKTSEDIIEKAQSLYNKGKWQEAIDLIDTFLTTDNEQIIAEGNRIKGWCYYYLGIKGDENKKIENLEESERHFRLALKKMKKEKGKISILNGLPLTLWILGKGGEAKLESFKATERFPQESSVWNTRSILFRWAKDFETSIELCEKVYETALAKKDFRTAGHGKQNKGDALKELGRIREAKKEYLEAKKMYEKDGESDFHIKRVKEKISNL
jgi:tetratricopeptide (TPR) repeat protein